MKIYFVGSIAGKDKYGPNYKKIVEAAKELGHKVLEDTLRPNTEEVYNITDEEKVDYYRCVLNWIKESDVVVAEASHPSIGVGFEISTALEKGKPVIVLYAEGQAPHFLEGLESEKLLLIKYDFEDLKKTLGDSLQFASEQADIRFNFFISPKISNFLDWMSKEKRIPRSVYLRRLIENDMNKNTEYQDAV